jgi:ubiquinone/menaquinone biosynthesis C-methylase UbiE
MNYFAPKEAAQRYANGRPDVHAYSIGQVSTYLQLDKKLDSVLDIACGTGLSTRALLSIGERVYGTDISEEMLALAPCKDLICYYVSAAELQPFKDHFFDLITVSSGVHWFDIDRFLHEACRILKSRAWLVLYENHFDAVLEGVPAFKEWFTNIHLTKFPTPPRNNRYDWSNGNLETKGLHFKEELRSTYAIPMTKKQLALYLTTQSNVIAKVEGGELGYDEVLAWLDEALDAFFPRQEGRCMVNFGNWIKFIQRIN